MKKLQSNLSRVFAVVMAFVLALTPISPISVWHGTTDVKAAGTEMHSIREREM